MKSLHVSWLVGTSIGFVSMFIVSTLMFGPSFSEGTDCRIKGYVATGLDGVPGTVDDHYFEPGSWAEACLMLTIEEHAMMAP